MSMIVNPFVFGGGGGGGSPSTSEIIITGNAEIEASNIDIIGGSSSFASGVTGAHGRVYDTRVLLKSYTYPAGQEEFVSAGCRFYFETNSTDAIFAIRRLAGSTNHVILQRVAGGAFRVSDTANTTNYDGSSTISLNTWYYATLYVRIADSPTGEFIARLYDASGSLIEQISQTGIDTWNGGNKAEFTLWGASAGDSYVDDLWTDIAGAFRDAGYVETLSPTSNGDTNSWSRGGTDTGANWDQVDEVPKNTTSYVFSTGADQVELYNFQDRTQAGTPIAIQQITYARAHTAGTRDYKPICKVGGVVYEGSTFSVSSTSDSLAPGIYTWQNNPATGNAWVDSDINAAQFGVKSVTTDVRVHCLGLQVLVGL